MSRVVFMTEQKKELLIFSSMDALLAKADSHTDNVDKEFQSSARYYFIARYFVSIFESRFGGIPIQVWNEYRNALDHFFRYQTVQNKEGSNHLKKMEGHILRAVLDVLKLFSHNSNIYIAETISTYKPESLNLVDNGRFAIDLHSDSRAAMRKFELAKVSDSQLGDEATSDMTVLNSYLDAAFSLDKIITTIKDRQEDIIQAHARHEAISNKASNHTTRHHLIVHTIFYILKYPVIVGLTYLSTTYWESTLQPLLYSSTEQEQVSAVPADKTKDVQKKIESSKVENPSSISD